MKWSSYWRNAVSMFIPSWHQVLVPLCSCANMLYKQLIHNINKNWQTDRLHTDFACSRLLVCGVSKRGARRVQEQRDLGKNEGGRGRGRGGEGPFLPQAPLPFCHSFFVLKQPALTEHLEQSTLDSEDDFHPDCRNISPRQQLFLELPSHRPSTTLTAVILYR